MITPQDIDKLAALARIRITDEENAAFGSEIDSILTYVDTLKKATVQLDTTPTPGSIKNILRPDANPNPSGANTEAILAEALDREGQYLKVKKIL